MVGQKSVHLLSTMLAAVALGNDAYAADDAIVADGVETTGIVQTHVVQSCKEVKKTLEQVQPTPRVVMVYTDRHNAALPPQNPYGNPNAYLEDIACINTVFASRKVDLLVLNAQAPKCYDNERYCPPSQADQLLRQILRKDSTYLDDFQEEYSLEQETIQPLSTLASYGYDIAFFDVVGSVTEETAALQKIIIENPDKNIVVILGAPSKGIQGTQEIHLALHEDPPYVVDLADHTPQEYTRPRGAALRLQQQDH
jgi:hypothetical protein